MVKHDINPAVGALIREWLTEHGNIMRRVFDEASQALAPIVATEVAKSLEFSLMNHEMKSTIRKLSTLAEFTARCLERSCNGQWYEQGGHVGDLVADLYQAAAEGFDLIGDDRLSDKRGIPAEQEADQAGKGGAP